MSPKWHRPVFAAFLFISLSGNLADTQDRELRPVTDAMLQDPDPADWLMWRRTLDSWGYSPLEQITRENVHELRLVWSRALTPGSQQGTPLVYNGIMYMPNPGDVIQAMNAVTGDLLWEYRREHPDDWEGDVWQDTNRNLAIYGPRSSTRVRTSMSLPPTRSPAGWSGKPKSSTTRITPLDNPPDRSLPTAR